MTDISVSATTRRRAPSRLWLAGEHGADAPLHVPYDFTTFSHENFSAGYIPNGTILGKITASKLFGPYDPAATDGRETAAAIAFNDDLIPDDKTRVVTGAAVRHCGVVVSGLPFKSGPGSLDAAARAALAGVIQWFE